MNDHFLCENDMLLQQLLKLFKKIILLPILIYQYAISPLMPQSCRFYPTCSEYSKIAIKEHGVIRGLFLSIKRILRCHPWGGCGKDLVPEKKPCSRKHSK